MLCAERAELDPNALGCDSGKVGPRRIVSRCTRVSTWSGLPAATLRD